MFCKVLSSFLCKGFYFYSAHWLARCYKPMRTLSALQTSVKQPPHHVGSLMQGTTIPQRRTVPTIAPSYRFNQIKCALVDNIYNICHPLTNSASRNLDAKPMPYKDTRSLQMVSWEVVFTQRHWLDSQVRWISCCAVLTSVKQSPRQSKYRLPRLWQLEVAL